MQIARRCPSCNSVWVNWNIKLQTVEKVYAHDCHVCGEIEITSRRKYGGMPYWLLFLVQKTRSLTAAGIVRRGMGRHSLTRRR